MRSSIRSFVVLLAAVAAAGAHAALVVFDDPNLVVTVPTTGTATYMFSGTITYDEFWGAGIYEPYTFDGTEHLTMEWAPNFIFHIWDKSPYVGDFFSFTVNPSTAPGYYAYHNGLLIGSHFEVNDGQGANTFRAPFSVTVLPAQAVPEPATFAAMGVGALALLRRRKKA